MTEAEHKQAERVRCDTVFNDEFAEDPRCTGILDDCGVCPACGSGCMDAYYELRDGIEKLIHDLTLIGAISRHEVPVKGRSIIVERLRSLLESLSRTSE